jgi:gluconate 2-dehydrogenase alpha chain
VIAHPQTEVVIVGSGWAGSIAASELAKHDVPTVMLERGKPRSSAEVSQKMDELRFAVDLELMQNTATETVTMRHNLREPALPYRRWGGFLVGDGVGGAGTHWNGLTYRFHPRDFQIRSHTAARYGKTSIPADMLLQDWGIAYDDLEPYYDRFEYMAGISGKAGNLAGKLIPGGNPFEGPRSREYPTPPMKSAEAPTVFRDAANKAGYHAFPEPSANLSEYYKNPDGIARAACNFCGFCARYACEVSAKASPESTVLPIAQRSKRFELRTDAYVTSIEHDASKATGVRYVDAAGLEHFQPAHTVILAAYVFNNTRLLLLSKIGRPYDPAGASGVVGRNFAHQTTAYHTAFFNDRRFKPWMGAGANGWAIDDLNADNFDHADLDFIGGGLLACEQTGAAPIGAAAIPKGTPAWGQAWKDAITYWYDRSMSLVFQGESLSYRNHFIDLDPTYVDAHGLPLARFAFDFTDNERKMIAWQAQAVRKIFGAANATKKNIQDTLPEHYDSVRYQTSHVTGGVPMGADPATSAVNTYLQMWDMPNLFVMGASAFPQNGGMNPTATIGAITYRAVEAILQRYRKRPGELLV